MRPFVIQNPNERVFSDIILKSVESTSIIRQIIRLLVDTKDSEESSKVLIPEVQNCETDEEFLNTVKRVISERKL